MEKKKKKKQKQKTLTPSAETGNGDAAMVHVNEDDDNTLIQNSQLERESGLLEDNASQQSESRVRSEN